MIKASPIDRTRNKNKNKKQATQILSGVIIILINTNKCTDKKETLYIILIRIENKPRKNNAKVVTYEIKIIIFKQKIKQEKRKTKLFLLKRQKD